MGNHTTSQKIFVFIHRAALGDKANIAVLLGGDGARVGFVARFCLTVTVVNHNLLETGIFRRAVKMAYTGGNMHDIARPLADSQKGRA